MPRPPKNDPAAQAYRKAEQRIAKAALEHATLLDLSLPGLTSVPPEIGSLTALTELYLHDNTALGIPDSVLGPTFDEVHLGTTNTTARPRDILNFYFARIQAEAAGTARPIHEIKAMLVGRGGAGKTSLRRFFMGEKHDKNETETPGIALETFPLVCQQGELTVRLWDFAGQEITHALHQFFLTEDCVYLLVLDPRSNTEMQDAEYWLGLLQRYAGNAPVLLVLNRQDARQGGYEVDRRMLQERFPLIHSFTATNCATGTSRGLRRTAAARRRGSVAANRAATPASARDVAQRDARLRRHQGWQAAHDSGRIPRDLP